MLKQKIDELREGMLSFTHVLTVYNLQGTKEGTAVLKGFTDIEKELRTLENPPPPPKEEKTKGKDAKKEGGK